MEGNQKMTLVEARKFYFEYCGYSFHMGREEPVRYSSFSKLNLSEETLGRWDQELLDGYFEKMSTDRENAWVSHGHIIRIIMRNHADAEANLIRLLNAMTEFDDLDLFNLTLILENMAGRTSALSDGGVRVCCCFSDQAERMNEIMEHLIESFRSRENVDGRFESAVLQYRRAFIKWNSPAEIK